MTDTIQINLAELFLTFFEAEWMNEMRGRFARFI